ncbi:DNA-directed RNA polymerase specialized sigma subunit, sigma24 [Frankia casuarinae]|uniref:Sigma-24 n=1 Tax=Frankia casuarinae (strain DSM 45818 / CECT 9043 / HFP020203 / CcI3) TaxID=106370 RepID=Q2JFS4_FRACC|nr:MULTISPECIES: sigma-70 family RNA polymerase sigma factor [Frankia]ABD09868.1 sigma-24 [Frankia casuarinae]ETA04423.1 DNA-directed RNA polymerase specialized sigma subunit, sigma24 [Frankia sp. CcI6]EYT92325.1 DNA-directed RNA polymerase specialized sigma subunit, sigma24 [Frankia casuarinae]KDA44878.1 DNA-directed RNA polymerase specialized sigma subunit, sigma24 [Frankia sp. BMG5.23]KEZ38076.1 RNA polymerase sigma factor, sigma-70 family [Frankia sp. CeD]
MTECTLADLVDLVDLAAPRRGPLRRQDAMSPVGAREDRERVGDPQGDPADDDRTALVARARRGDVNAFGLLYDRYANLVFRYALYRLGGDPVAAEDIVSETFLRAFRSIGTFQWQGRDIGAWFITIARNLLVDQARSARRRFEIPTADILAAAEHRATALTAPSPEESILAVLTRRELLDAVRELRPDQQECVALRFLEGLSVRETALAMGRNEGAVKSLQFRAIRTLARALPAAGTA